MIMYALSKVHKRLVDFSPLRPILSVLILPAYQLAKFPVPVLSTSTINEYTVRDWFDFSSFNDTLFKQVDRLALGSPRGPILANAFLVFLEKQ